MVPGQEDIKVENNLDSAESWFIWVTMDRCINQAGCFPDSESFFKVL